MVARDYIETFNPTCVFYDGIRENEPQCGKAAVAVYIKADESQRALWVCPVHGRKAEAGGDGPVFWTLKPIQTKGGV